MSKETQLSKGILRKEFRAVRDSLSKTYCNRSAARIASRLLSMPEVRAAKTAAVYLSKGSEADTFPILKKLVDAKKTVLAPRVLSAGRQLEFCRIRRGLGDCHLGFYSVWEPNEDCPKVPPGRIDVLLVPGIAFDWQGYRLGYGKGYYDRFLLVNRIKVSVGLTYEKTFTTHIPHEATDAPVGWVVTEERTHKVV
ncbi:MAG: 5-formyltetrahydrofolate cyclo-ligase [Elusimicrobia bacterium RIFCSPLOWO2_01_FULL_64_13]|nr:MAG: 5-formyltetrahydrofolate cyclo-ligase [Elusimicrobia bacterium RIFCSPHIGHO2_01_FULL_64_10]OGR95779.1 MAG: 5-formyltetrahydrofolate cyclo-ligase [Elusimicrobia bacterium RIFCSPLOWO2_01_FULL_64_13]